jgi:esterase/lipase
MPDNVAPDEAETKLLAEQLYDLIMADIEPDLLLANIPTLDQKYTGETPEEHAARMKRYEASYKKFDAEFSKFMTEVNEKVKTTKRTTLKEAEEQAKNQEENKLNSLESAFS